MNTKTSTSRNLALTGCAIAALLAFGSPAQADAGLGVQTQLGAGGALNFSAPGAGGAAGFSAASSASAGAGAQHLTALTGQAAFGAGAAMNAASHNWANAGNAAALIADVSATGVFAERGDSNLDGVADILISPNPARATLPFSLNADGSTAFHNTVVAAGDFNADGIGDILITPPAGGGGELSARLRNHTHGSLHTVLDSNDAATEAQFDAYLDTVARAWQ